MKENILGYDVCALSRNMCVNSLFQSLCENKKIWLACFNPHSYVMTLKDNVFACALKSADWLVPDGAGVLLASRILGGEIAARITGSDVFAGLHERMNAVGGMSVFLLGVTEETLNLIRARMCVDYPNIRIAGAYSPPFKSEFTTIDNQKMVTTVNATRSDVLWIGMSAPKQEKFIYENLHLLNVRFVGAVGAVFDFYSGRVKRSAPFYQNAGLEWLPRLLQQPSRFWRRMLVSAPVFVYHVLKQRYSLMQRRN